MKILQVNTAVDGGGAERIASDLAAEYRRRGHESWLAVGRKPSGPSPQGTVPFVLPNAQMRSRWAKAWAALPQSRRRLRSLPFIVGQPSRWLDLVRGREDFHFPASWRLDELPPEPPDVIHCHNLHGPGDEAVGYFDLGYFDLRALPELSARRPVVLTLHDMWLLTGHCAHPFRSDRWLTGCGDCPDLWIYPAVRRDATAFNWRRKRDIFARSRLYVATPSRWLLDQVERSILAPAIVESRVIPNGIDLAIFQPGDSAEARRALGLPLDARIVLLVRPESIWREPGAVATLEQRSAAVVVTVDDEHDPARVAEYYRAADVYVHAARADTFPTTVLEAMACGVPAVATGVGGIPEQITPKTGVLTTTRELVESVEALLADDERRRRLGANAAEYARTHFDLRRMADDYLDWYGELSA